MALVKYSCPSCGYVIQPFSAPTYSFGDPRQTCPRCERIYIASYITEWDLESTHSKAAKVVVFYFYLLVGPVILAFILAFILSALAQSYIDYFAQTKSTTGHLLFIGQALVYYPLFAYFIYGGDHQKFWKAIKDSKQRTSDPGYLAAVKKTVQASR